MQGVEICNALGRQVNDLGVNYQRRTKACRFLHDPRKALRPIISVHRVKAHATIPHMNLQAVAIVLEFVQPVWPAGRALGDDWPGGTLIGRPRGLRDMASLTVAVPQFQRFQQLHTTLSLILMAARFGRILLSAWSWGRSGQRRPLFAEPRALKNQLRNRIPSPVRQPRPTA